MLKVSDAYKAEMLKPIRNRTKIRVTHRLVDFSNEELKVQEGVTVPSVAFNSDSSILYEFEHPVTNHYAYLAKDSMMINKGMLCLPDTEELDIKNNGFIPDVVSGSALTFDGYEYGSQIDLEASGDPFDISGLYIEFDKITQTWPSKLTVVAYDVDSVELYNESLENDSVIFKLEAILEGVNKISIIITHLNKPETYMRITECNFGIVLTYDNSNLMDNAFDYQKYINVRSNELSYAELSLNIKNYPTVLYDPFDDDNIYKKYSDFQKLRFELGREFDDGSVEWLEVANLYTSGNIEMKDYYFTIKAKDVLSLYTSTGDGALLQTIPNEWTFAEYLEELKTYSDKPFKDTVVKFTDEVSNTNIPTYQSQVLNVNEIYQLVANYNRDVVLTNNLSQIEFKNTVLPDVSFEDNGVSYLSDVQAAYYDMATITKLYASLQYNAMKLMLYEYLMVVPDNTLNLVSKYIESSEVGGVDGLFTTNPKIKIIYSSPTDISILYLAFNTVEQTYAINFTVTYYDESDTIIQVVSVDDNDETVYSQNVTILNCKYYEIEIIEWSEPYRSVIITQIGNSLTTGFSLTLASMFNYPSISTNKKPARLNHNYHVYIEKEFEEIIPSVTGYKGTNGATGLKVEIITSECYSDFDHVVLSGTGTESVIAIKDANKYVFYYSNVSDEMEFQILAKGLEVKTYTVYKSYEKSGDVLTFNNPYVISETKANEQMAWYEDYIEKGETIKVNYRGNPELEPLDYIYIDTKTQRRVAVIVTKIKLKYNLGLTGEMEVLRI